MINSKIDFASLCGSLGFKQSSFTMQVYFGSLQRLKLLKVSHKLRLLNRNAKTFSLKQQQNRHQIVIFGTFSLLLNPQTQYFFILRFFALSCILFFKDPSLTMRNLISKSYLLMMMLAHYAIKTIMIFDAFYSSYSNLKFLFRFG